MKLHSIVSKPGSVKKARRVGRGNGSGRGTFSGRGCKGAGQHAVRSISHRQGFEGGQMPLIMRLPKLRGFKNPNKKIYQTVNVSDLEVFKDGEEVNAKTLLDRRLIASVAAPVKVLGDGKLTKKLTVKADKFSASAKAQILKAGGKVL
jgi:large subunit ribosomal protein L15